MKKKTASKLNEHDLEKCLIEFFNLNNDDKSTKTTGLNEIKFVLKGDYTLESSLHGNINLKKGDGVYIPTSCEYKDSGKECIGIVIRLEDSFILKRCKCSSSFIKSDKETEYNNNKPFILTVNSLLEKYLDNLYLYLQDEVGCALLYEIKIKELIYILTQSYPKTTLTNFFHIDPT